MIGNIVAIFYYVSREKLFEHDTFKLKQLKRWLRENIILANRVKYKNKKITNLSKIDAFIMVKEHKSNFPTNIDCRILNPSKNSLG